MTDFKTKAENTQDEPRVSYRIRKQDDIHKITLCWCEYIKGKQKAMERASVPKPGQFEQQNKVVLDYNL